MSDLIQKSELIEEVQKYFVNNNIHKNDLAEVIAKQPTVEAKPVEWIPIEWHETTDDDEIDKERYPLYLDCAMPDDAQEIIICRKNGWVNVDTCIYDDGYSLDSGADWIEDVIAWMPLPAPYNADMRGGKND